MDAKFFRLLAANIEVCAETCVEEASKVHHDSTEAIASLSSSITLQMLASSVIAALDQLAKEPA